MKLCGIIIVKNRSSSRKYSDKENLTCDSVVLNRYRKTNTSFFWKNRLGVISVQFNILQQRSVVPLCFCPHLHTIYMDIVT